MMTMVLAGYVKLTLSSLLPIFIPSIFVGESVVIIELLTQLYTFILQSFRCQQLVAQVGSDMEI